MTTTEALSIIESHTALSFDPKMAEALRVVRKALPKARKARAPKMHPASKLGRPVLFGQLAGAGRGWDTPTRTARVHLKQRELYLATFADPKAQAERINGLARSLQFDYDPPARMKDDERRTLIAALVAL
jgi:hypothetical protein